MIALLLATVLGAAIAQPDPPIWEPISCACLPAGCRGVTIRPAEPVARLLHGDPAGCIRRAGGEVTAVCGCVPRVPRRCRSVRLRANGALRAHGCGGILIL